MKVPDLPPGLYDVPGPVLKYIEYLKTMIKKYKYDDLTHLPVRRDFRKALDEYAKNNNPFTLYLIDLNGLKTINDNLSYEDGDKFLLKVVNELSERGGTLFRLGGDEFTLISEREELPLISTEEYCVGRSGFEESKSAKEYFKAAEKHLKQEKLRFYEEQGICRRK